MSDREKDRRIIRLFISSPNDVGEERAKARQVIEGLERFYAGLATLEVVMWEDLALDFGCSAQESIAKILEHRGGIDVAVFILWSRLGSPLSEQVVPKPGGGFYRSGTEHEFDLMVEAWEASGRNRPHILAYFRDDEKGFLESLKMQAPERYKEALEQKESARRFVEERFMDEQGRNIRGLVIYGEPVSFARRLEKHLREVLDRILAADRSTPNWTEAPYRSLEIFDIQHAPIFCGRDGEICDVVDRLREREEETDGCAFVCIVGASGSGKSSLARAGVAATLIQRSFDDGVKEWRTTVFLPGLVPGDLFLGLARTLAQFLPELEEGVGGIEELAGCFRDQNLKAAGILVETAIKEAGIKLGGRLRFLLVLDQMEELWTDATLTTVQRENFLLCLESLGRSASLSVLATLRSDFYAQAQSSETFLRMKGEAGHFDLTPPGTAAMQELIVQPAHRAGLTFERDERTGRTLDQLILEDASRDPSSLPLLQYALTELHQRQDQDRRQLTYAAYETMGGVEGALVRCIGETFSNLSESARAADGEVLSLLVAVDAEGGQKAVRRHASVAELTATESRAALTSALIAARFLITDSDKDGLPTACLAHESLLRKWPLLTEWIEQNRDLLRVRERIEARMNEGSPLLDGDPLLESAKAFVALSPEVFTRGQSEFIETARRKADAKRLRALRLRRRVTAGLAILSCLAFAGAVWALVSKNATEKAQAKSEASRKQAEELLEFSLGKTSRLLKAKGNTADLVELQKKVDAYYAALGTEDSDAPQLRRRGWSYVNDGDTALKLGETARAEEAYSKALEVFSALVRADPRNVDLRQELGTVYGSIASALKNAGRMKEALDASNQYVEATESALSGEPETRHLQREFAAALFRRGDLRMVLREPTAKADHQKALDLRLALVEDDDKENPNPAWLSDLASSWHAIATLSMAAKDPDKAFAAATESARIRELLVARDSDNAEWITDLAASLRLLASLDLRAGRADESLSNLGKARDLLLALHTQDVDFVHNLAVTQKLYGDLFAKKKDFAGARDSYQAGLEVLVPVAERGQASLSFQRTIGLTWYSLSQVLEQLTDKPAALTACRNAISSYEVMRKSQALSKSQVTELEKITKDGQRLEADVEPPPAANENLLQDSDQKP